MGHPTIGSLARLMQPQVLVHIATKGSLRGCAQSQGIHALTVEVSKQYFLSCLASKIAS